MRSAKELAAWPATFTHEDDEHAGHLYYFKPANASPGPYTVQRHVDAIIDIADDGTLAGVELIYGMPPPPAADYIERMAPPADGPEFETTAEERQAYFDKNGPAFRGTFLFKALRDLDKAIASEAAARAFASSETQRADEVTRRADAIATGVLHTLRKPVDQSEMDREVLIDALYRERRDLWAAVGLEEGNDHREIIKKIDNLKAERDREAAARRDAETALASFSTGLTYQVLAEEHKKAEARAEQAEAELVSARGALDALTRTAGTEANLRHAAEAREATLRAALRDADEIITAVVDPGLVPRSLEEIYEAYEARAALATTSTGEGE